VQGKKDYISIETGDSMERLNELAPQELILGKGPDERNPNVLLNL
jgi:hypothetical protein